MSYAFSLDGTTIDKVSDSLPRETWVDTTTPGGVSKGTFVDLTEANKNSYNWYFFDDTVVQPSLDHVSRGAERVGNEFSIVWVFDQGLQDNRLANEARNTKRLSDISDLRAGRTSAADLRDLMAEILEEL